MKTNQSKILTLLLLVAAVSALGAYSAHFNRVAVERYAVHFMASVVGITAEIPVNEHNMIALQLREKEESLLQKEKELQEKEREFGEISKSKDSDTLRYVALVGATLFVLLTLNFYLDLRRSKAVVPSKRDEIAQ